MNRDQAEGRGKTRMRWAVRSALAVAAAATLAGCATYDYGPGYGYTTYGYNDAYDYGPYSYDNGYYYDYGPSGYVAPSVGFGFTYRDSDREHYNRDYYRHRNDYREHNDYRGGDNNQWRGDRDRAHSAAPWPSGPNDPWGGTNKPNDRTSQQ